MTNAFLGWSLQRFFLPNKKEMRSGWDCSPAPFRYVENQVYIFWQVTHLQRPMDCMTVGNESASEHLHKRIIYPYSDQMPMAGDEKEFSLIFCILVTHVPQASTMMWLEACHQKRSKSNRGWYGLLKYRSLWNSLISPVYSCWCLWMTNY